VRREVEGLTAERMNRAFWDSVKQETDKEINIRLPGAWKSFLAGTATSFMLNSLQAQLLSLAATMDLSCPKCGGNVSVTLTPNEISILVQKGKITFVCPYSQGMLWRHRFRITLGELIWLIMKGNVIPRSHLEPKTIRTRVLKRGDINDKGVRNEGSDQPNNP